MSLEKYRILRDDIATCVSQSRITCNTSRVLLYYTENKAWRRGSNTGTALHPNAGLVLVKTAFESGNMIDHCLLQSELE